MRIAGLVIATLWLVACSGDGDGDGDGGAGIDAPRAACGASGGGSVTGSVGGATVAPVVRANQVTIPGERVVIVLDEVGGACGVPAPTGEHLVLGFCDAPTVRTYAVVGAQAFGCPGMDAFGLVEQDGGHDFGVGLSGTVTITAIEGTCVSGAFDISFMASTGMGTPESMSGTFDAVVCP